ncbi:exonuclease SbcCD subunit D [Siminovitchia sp. FSL W7-1587]|uniref:exonuclease SbcCD subunit D n=1 Tax=Siminovitchia sp. FSL W7-1587 TaxID=2954699 RepID=UPI0030D16003
MKIIHTADWHLGKLVHGVYMTEQQRIVLDQFINLVAVEKPDAVIISGDLYDRSVPPVEAVKLLEEVLFKINVELNTPVLAIAGNHDSPDRLAFGSSWYRHSQFYIQGRLDHCFQPVDINGVHFYLVPYAEPGIVRDLFQDDSIQSFQDAAMRISGEIEKNMDQESIAICVGHAFVTGGKTTDSERILSVGGSGCVDVDCFSPFTYTALGHLHSPDAIKHESIRYSGSLLKYSFSEVNQRKSVSIIQLRSNGEFSIEEKTLTPEKDMRELTGLIDELLDPSFYNSQKTDDYLKITLLDEGAILDPMNKLRSVYPNVLHLERNIEVVDMKRQHLSSQQPHEKKTNLELFSEFYSEMTTREFTEQKRERMEKVLESVLKEEIYA